VIRRWPRRDEQPPLDRPGDLTEPGADVVLGLAEAQQGEAGVEEDDAARIRLIDDAQQAKRDPGQVTPVGGGEALEI
jgi:hypothetical protein